MRDLSVTCSSRHLLLHGNAFGSSVLKGGTGGDSCHGGLCSRLLFLGVGLAFPNDPLNLLPVRVLASPRPNRSPSDAAEARDEGLFPSEEIFGTHADDPQEIGRRAFRALLTLLPPYTFPCT